MIGAAGAVTGADGASPQPSSTDGVLGAAAGAGVVGAAGACEGAGSGPSGSGYIDERASAGTAHPVSVAATLGGTTGVSIGRDWRLGTMSSADPNSTAVA